MEHCGVENMSGDLVELIEAAEAGRYDEAQALLQRNKHLANTGIFVELLEAAEVGRYDEALALLKKNRELAKYVDPCGGTLLHRVCQRNAPIGFIRTLLSYGVQAVSMQDNNGRTPLHTVCIFTEVPDETVLTILEASPKRALSLRDRTGRIPLHYALLCRSVSVTRSILRRDPSQLNTCEEIHKVAMNILLPDFRAYYALNLIQTYLNSSSQENLYLLDDVADDESVAKKLFVMYQKLLAVLEAKHFCGSLEGGAFLQLHAILSSDESHPVFFDLAMGLHPEQASTPDRNGNLPLHTTCSSSPARSSCVDFVVCTRCDFCSKRYFEVLSMHSSSTDGLVLCHSCLLQSSRPTDFELMEERTLHVIKKLLKVYPLAASTTNEEGLLPLHIIIREQPTSDVVSDGVEIKLRHTAGEMIKALLDSYPQGALIRDPLDQSLPLISAIIRGKHWDNGVEYILKAAPNVLKIREPSSGMYPFMFAAMERDAMETEENSQATSAGTSDIDLRQLSTVFCLLREGPEILQGIVSGE